MDAALQKIKSFLLQCRKSRRDGRIDARQTGKGAVT
jgi:hypothetical protein